MLSSGTRVRGFEPGRNHWIFRVSLVIVHSFASRGLSRLCGAWRLWRRMKELVWGKSTISLRLQCWKSPTKRSLNPFLKYTYIFWVSQKFPAFYGTPISIVVSTKNRHFSIPWTRQIWPIPYHPTTLRFAHQHLSLPRNFLVHISDQNSVSIYLFSHTHHTLALLPLQ